MTLCIKHFLYFCLEIRHVLLVHLHHQLVFDREECLTASKIKVKQDRLIQADVHPYCWKDRMKGSKTVLYVNGEGDVIDQFVSQFVCFLVRKVESQTEVIE